ncbi:glycosyltransferase family 2 protein [Babjeviella inositovora NRRL Y-12698]|uniref:Chitin synthase n=1 Tax=Babjeviella inositovora NRRL Y-12698 TaxID=984486 RepID=A0A1E3QJD0_9ASCO|nr:glycosyltransferase family 2 protein [Babjeviella inositovora NRRL Y-12698]ODQ77760.1 glycosyltransferase family 2 protein [Babjeviella inositovora NRRL Y-12698]
MYHPGDEFNDSYQEGDVLGKGLHRRATTLTRKKTFQTRNLTEAPKMRYTKTIKKAKLINGNFVLDCPVPKTLIDTYGLAKNGGSGASREFGFMRYQAVTCGPSNFLSFSFDVRQNMYTPQRPTEILICITMYNEDDVLLGKTLKGVFENIEYLCLLNNSATWGPDAWRKIVVCIVADGRVNLNPRTQALLASLGCYQDGFAKSKINEKNVKAHVYEYTTPVGIHSINDRVHLEPARNPVQLLFCLKEKNAKKINSHRWAFQAFCPLIEPKIVVLLDTGTQPSRKSIYHLWRAFNDENVAGACGEIKAALGPGNRLLLNPLVAAQNFEYKISNILDKPMESAFGFISVLPGAFSAYRYRELLNDDKGKGPLEKYFKGEFLHEGAQPEEDDDEKMLKDRNYEEGGIFTSNMYLAEDRILCYELVAKRKRSNVLRYVKAASAETDVPEALDEWILQRRRWLNGSFFAATYSIVHFHKIWITRHSLLSKLMFQVQFFYQVVSLLVSWFSLGSFFLVFRILTANLGESDMHFSVGKYLAMIFLWLYIGSVVSSFVLSFGNKPRGTKKFYMIIVCVFAVLMAYMIFAAVYLAIYAVKSVVDSPDTITFMYLFKNERFRDLVISLASTYALYFAASFIYGQPAHMFTSFVQYLLLSPAYINVLNIYSFCNINDVSWGTRGEASAKDLGTARISEKSGELVTIAPAFQAEIEDAYTTHLESLNTSPPSVVIIPAARKLRDDDYYAMVRSATVLAWMVTNGILIIIVLQTGGIDALTNGKTTTTNTSNTQIFLTIILWIVAFLAVFRFIGCIVYLLFGAARPLKWRLKARFRKREVLS